MSISSILKIAFALLAAVIVALGAHVTTKAVSDLRDIRRAALLAHADSTAMSATVAMSLERSVVQVALAFKDPMPQAFRDIVTEKRAHADAGLASAVSKIDATAFLPTKDIYISKVRASLSRVADIRAEIDALLLLPKDQRDVQRAYALPFELKQEVVNLKNANELLRNRVSVSAATRILSRLADGDLDVSVRRNRHELKEIKDLFSTVDSFRKALLDAKRLEEEARQASEKQKQAEHREASREREQVAERAKLAEQEKATALENNERERRAAAEIAAVVEACASGDFSSRLSVNDKVGIFAEICDGMNRIGEAADNGLGAVRTALENMAKGDLSQRMPTDFQGIFADIASAMNETTDSLSKTLLEISHSAANVEGVTQGISATTQQLSKRAESNSASLAETANDLSAMTVSVQSAASAARTAGAAVKSIEEMAQSGNEVVSQTIVAMSEIKESSDEIGTVLSLIDDIAFQTNLLALNAGVEAARAGEAGRGFAVVATEVRALAQRSSEAASEIAKLVGNASENVMKGVELVNNSGEALKNIVTGVEDASAKLNDIVLATSKTSTAIGEISQSTQDLDRDTRQNSNVFKDTEAQAQKLNSVAAHLTASVGAFRLGNEKLAPLGDELKAAS